MIDPRTELLLSKAKFTFIRDQGCCGRTADNPADLEWAAAKAYLDMAPRTIKGLGSASNKTREDIKHLTVATADKIATTIAHNTPSGARCQEDFDEIHRALCTDFLNQLNSILEQRSNEPSIDSQSYGKAQKLVNMLFKYLSCFSDIDSRSGWFDLCHMPIDAYVLSWCKKNGIRARASSWSKLNEEDYAMLQERIRGKLAEGALSIEGIPLPSRPLDAEFIIWSEQRMRARTRS